MHVYLSTRCVKNSVQRSLFAYFWVRFGIKNKAGLPVLVLEAELDSG
jgi:hypothetical protein